MFARAPALIGVLAMAALLAGCATTRTAVPAGARAPDPDRFTQWTARGRIALAAQGEGGSGSFVWQQRSERTELALRGPLGAGGLQLTMDGEALELADPGGAPLDGDAARAELERRLGARLPLAEMRYWLLGLPAPADVADGPVQLATGAMPGFVQAGWVVSYDALGAQGEWTLPARLTATSGSARVRIVIDDWTVPPP
jgi:outer membrane lipoprotein LolB